ncbi:hypothetical protein NXY41_09705 [Bacteroides fragilis]|nr:hypothetical protein [Bacteroides fragilis]MCS2878867.1 hypothetical protein [Bacteroides fragilis]
MMITSAKSNDEKMESKQPEAIGERPYPPTNTSSGSLGGKTVKNGGD